MDILDALNELKQLSDADKGLSYTDYAMIRDVATKAPGYVQKRGEAKNKLDVLVNNKILGPDAYEALVATAKAPVATAAAKSSSNTPIHGFGFGFALAFFLSLIGFVIAYFLGDYEAKRGAIRGFITAVIVAVVVGIITGIAMAIILSLPSSGSRYLCALLPFLV